MEPPRGFEPRTPALRRRCPKRAHLQRPASDACRPSIASSACRRQAPAGLASASPSHLTQTWWPRSPSAPSTAAQRLLSAPRPTARPPWPRTGRVWITPCALPCPLLQWLWRCRIWT